MDEPQEITKFRARCESYREALARESPESESPEIRLRLEILIGLPDLAMLVISMLQAREAVTAPGIGAFEALIVLMAKAFNEADEGMKRGAGEPTVN